MQIPIYTIVKPALLVLLICTCVFQQADAQNGYTSAGVLYKDNDMSIELQVKLNPCNGNNTKPCRFRYVITGQPKGGNYFVNWKMDYYNCDNSITCQTNYVNIGTFIPDDNGAIIDDMDWSFTAIRLYRPFYEVTTSYTADLSKPYKKPLPMSVKPTRIAGDLSIDYGDAVTLTQHGGALGENATWHWYTASCGGNPAGDGESITVRPFENTRYYLRAEGPNGNTDCISAQVTVNTKSHTATNIDGHTSICIGEKSMPLTVNGGKLGRLAKWVWYQDSSGGNSIGTGTQIYVSPQRTTSYFVRAEGADNITESRTITIHVTTDKSTDPTGITGSASVCEGKSVALQVTGGKLASDAQWCWYQNGTSAGNQIGKGKMITVTPQQTTTYYVRAEGSCRTTTEQTAQVVMVAAPRTPSGIEASSTNVYRGQKVTLSVQGGSLGENSYWAWYKKKIKGKPIGTGESIRVRLHKPTVYYVRGENECGSTQARSQRIGVSRRFVFINGGIVTNFRTPTADGGAASGKGGFSKAIEQKTFALTVGRVKSSGWYARIKYSISQQKAEYTTDDKTVLDYTSTANYYEYNGKTQDMRLSATVGMLYNLTPNSLLLNLGVGYGERRLLWGLTEYSYQTQKPVKESWAKHSLHSFSGLEAEVGIMIKLPVFNIMLGGNAVIPLSSDNSQNKSAYSDVYAGIGINF
jgi:hypothetical protein